MKKGNDVPSPSNDEPRPPSDSGSSSDSDIIPDEIGQPVNMSSPSNAPPSTSSSGSPRPAQHRPRGNSVWAFQQSSSTGVPPVFASGGGGGAAAGGGTRGDRTVQHRDVYEIEHALQYRTVMRQHAPSLAGATNSGVKAGSSGGSHAPPLTFAQNLHVAALVHDYLTTNGFSWAADAYRKAVPVASTFSIPKRPSETVDFHLLIAEEARRTSLLFDDDIPWRMEKLTSTEVQLMQVDQASQAAGGPVELLVEKLILSERDMPTVEGKPEFNFTNIFLIMAPLFVCPDVLLTFLMKLYKTISVQSRALVAESRIVEVQRRILSVLRAYVLFNSSDFTVTALERLTAFCVNVSMMQNQSRSSSTVLSAISDLRAAVQETVSEGTSRRIGKIRSSDHKGNDSSSMLPPRFSASAVIRSVLDIDDHELCRQLCLLSFSLFEAVHLRELFHNAWTDAVSLRYITGNLSALMEYSRNVQIWVASTVVQPEAVETRRTVYRKWIRVCRALYNAQNYELVNAVLEGLRDNAVHRLKKTVDGIEPDEREELEGLLKIMDPFNNTMQEISYLIDSPSIPTIAPLLGVFYRTEDTGKTVLFVDSLSPPLQVINWSRILQLAKPAFRWMSFQSLRYPFQLLPNVQRYLWQMPGRLHSDRLMDLSLRRESH